MAEHRIAEIEPFIVRMPLKSRWRSDPAAGGKEAVDFVIIRMTSDTGIVGVGEFSGTARWSGETAQGALALIRDLLAPAVIGSDPFDIGALNRQMDLICKHNWFAKAAIEMAAWDIHGRALSKPVHELLGGPCRPVTVYNRFSLGACTPERAREVTAEMVGAGFSTVKVKVGGNPADDIARVRAVRESLGDGTLVIDATGGWTADVAIATIRALRDYTLAMVEQPTIAGDYAAMARVRRETGCRLIADDGCFDLVQLRELVRNDCCDAISVYPGKNGGIDKARAIAEEAIALGLQCTIGSNVELDVGTAAMAQLVRSTAALTIEAIPGDMRGPAYYESSITRPPVRIDGPVTVVPDGPGLAVDVDWETVRAAAPPQ